MTTSPHSLRRSVCLSLSVRTSCELFQLVDDGQAAFSCDRICCRNSVRRALHCTYRYVWSAGAGNATLLRTVSDWLIVVTVLPLGFGLLLFPPLFPLALLLILVGMLEAGMLQGISDHALDGYLNAIQNSQPYEWA